VIRPKTTRVFSLGFFCVQLVSQSH